MNDLSSEESSTGNRKVRHEIHPLLLRRIRDGTEAAARGLDDGEELLLSFDPIAPLAGGRLALREEIAATPGSRDSFTLDLRAGLGVRRIGGPRHRPEAARPSAPARPGSPPGPLGPPDLVAGAPAGERTRIEAVFRDLPDGPEGLTAAIERYGKIEAAAPGSRIAAAVHAEICRRLQDRVGDGVLDPFLAPPAPVPVRILAMRLASLAPSFPAEARAALLGTRLADADPAVVRLAGRFLGEVRHAKAVEALIGGLNGLERRGDESLEARELRLSLASDLYRLLGTSASAATAREFEEAWSLLGRKLPEDPFAAGFPGRTTALRAHRAFGDVRSPPVVFVIDASSSMGLLVPPGRLPIPGDPEGKRPARAMEKFEWVRLELEEDLRGLPAGSRFEIIAFNRSARSFRGGLAEVSGAVLARAASFLEGVRLARWTDIDEALEKAFALREAATIALLSDGQPTRGPGIDAIDAEVFRRNYLRGVRVVAASFEASAGEPENLCSRLARRNFGWIRVLDAGSGAAPGAEPGASPADPIDLD